MMRSSLLALFVAHRSVEAFIPPGAALLSHPGQRIHAGPLRSTTEDAATSSDDAFSAFADSLDEESLFDSDDGSDGDELGPTWQESVDMLLDPDTPLAKRQILLSDLLNAREDVRTSVQDALAERKIDPILTPTGKRLQDGSRAVARQLTNDILPGLAEVVRNGPPTPGSTAGFPAVAEDLPTLVPKLGSRIFGVLSSQAKQNLELLQGDLADPSRIPGRISRQAAEVATEAKNVFRETPEGLSGPEYRVVAEGVDYEIREYEAYTVASSSMAKVGESYSADDLANGGAAFNALAAYLFGANAEGKKMEMTTPVSTTSLGEMRFYLKRDDGDVTVDQLPQPLTEEDEGFNEKGTVTLAEVPAARLAVRRFTGFVTEGEIARQKDALLSGLAADGVEVDVPHGKAVPHVVFQYNPPYTLPIVRRNEMAVPVRQPGVDVEAADLETEWVGKGAGAAATGKVAIEVNGVNNEAASSADGGAPSDDDAVGP